MMTIVTHVHLREGAGRDWDAAMRTRLLAARKASGWVGGQLLRPAEKPDRRVIVGTWRTRANWEAWHDDPQFTETRQRLDGLESAPAEHWWHDVVVNGGGAKHCQTAPWRRAKLFATASCLFVLGMGPILSMIHLGSDLKQPLTFLGIDLFRPWLFGALGGMIGGSARALWAFIVEVRAFEIYLRTGQQPSAMTRLFNEPVEHWFDFMWVWYLYLMKPIAGALIGFVVALLQEFGLVPFFGGQESRNAYGIVVVASLAGFFAEDAIDQLGRLLRGKREERA